MRKLLKFPRTISFVSSPWRRNSGTTIGCRCYDSQTDMDVINLSTVFGNSLYQHDDGRSKNRHGEEEGVRVLLATPATTRCAPTRCARCGPRIPGND